MISMIGHILSNFSLYPSKKIISKKLFCPVKSDLGFNVNNRTYTDRIYVRAIYIARLQWKYDIKLGLFHFRLPSLYLNNFIVVFF